LRILLEGHSLLRTKYKRLFNCEWNEVLRFYGNLWAGNGVHLELGAGPCMNLFALLSKGEKQITLQDIDQKTVCRGELMLRWSELCNPDIEIIISNLEDDTIYSGNRVFDTIHCHHVFHWLRGSFPNKVERVISTLRKDECLKSTSTFFGATAVVDGIPATLMSKHVSSLFNWNLVDTKWTEGDIEKARTRLRPGQIMFNQDDTSDLLKKGLETHFKSVDVELIGGIALFKASDLK